MTKIAVVYHSGYGHTEAQAKAVARGAGKVAATEVQLLTSEEAQQNWEALNTADAIIFGSPTYMGSASAQFKAFMDASSGIWFNRGWKDKVAAGFTTSASQSGDKLNTIVQLTIFAAQHGMIWVGNDLLPGNNSSTGSVNDLNRLGGFLGALAQANSDQGADVAPLQSDLLTAEHLGERVANITRKIRG
ncbi:Multimeric flavodoxin WrbA [Methylobacillus rhizosphaerae]|uniref:Flavoprotein WrbA n=1 Tax=Methylobacillus rhizosphaerae TaxID=551994 RepID=A0A238YBS6_9PROT|nr:flavodoxin family protein [Methylobacillus rhizosphaerae]SNR68736.1 Multimeric flavodoxin WrbA [Methylobacillus rhizosphaerae]